VENRSLKMDKNELLSRKLNWNFGRGIYSVLINREAIPNKDHPIF